MKTYPVVNAQRRMGQDESEEMVELSLAEIATLDRDIRWAYDNAPECLVASEETLYRIGELFGIAMAEEAPTTMSRGYAETARRISRCVFGKRQINGEVASIPTWAYVAGGAGILGLVLLLA